jgi:hypothetical protein
VRYHDRYALAVIWLVVATVAAFAFTYKYRWPHRHAYLWGIFFAVIVLLVVRLILPREIAIRMIDPPKKND